MPSFNYGFNADIFCSPIDAFDFNAKLENRGLEDYSGHRRIGLRGKGTVDRLYEAGFSLPLAINKCTTHPGGFVLQCVGGHEFWLISTNRIFSAEQRQTVEILNSIDNGTEAFFDLPLQHSHACFAMRESSLSGIFPRAFAKLCAIDLGPDAFISGDLVQTSVAKVSAVISKSEIDGQTLYLIQCDSAYACYLWTSIDSALKEFI